MQESWSFHMGKDAHEAAHNAVVLEEVAKMASAEADQSECETCSAARYANTIENMVQMLIMDRKILSEN